MEKTHVPFYRVGSFADERARVRVAAWRTRQRESPLARCIRGACHEQRLAAAQQAIGTAQTMLTHQPRQCAKYSEINQRVSERRPGSLIDHDDRRRTRIREDPDPL